MTVGIGNPQRDYIRIPFCSHHCPRTAAMAAPRNTHPKATKTHQVCLITVNKSFSVRAWNYVDTLHRRSDSLAPRLYVTGKKKFSQRSSYLGYRMYPPFQLSDNPKDGTTRRQNYTSGSKQKCNWQARMHMGLFSNVISWNTISPVH